jgi:tetratricopeptide (TPR) repeat protein
MPNTLHSAPAVPSRSSAPIEKCEIDRLTARASQLRASGLHRQAAQLLAVVAALLPEEWLAQYNTGALFLEANEISEAIRFFERALGLHPSAAAYTTCAHALALRGDMSASRGMYERALTLAPRDFDAHWGLFEVNQLLDDNAAAIRHQQLALAERSVVSIAAHVLPARTTILELCVAGTFQANIPLDFILDQERTTVHKLYLGEHPIPALPPYDLVFNMIADAPNVAGALTAAATFIAQQDRPALNAPQLVELTSRDSVAALFANSSHVAVAKTVRTARASALHQNVAFPFLIRPLDSHAGNDLAKIDDVAALDAYLSATPNADQFYLSAFVDYRNADGYFRKYRIVFVDSVPYPVHLAISPRWMIHYYNAAMAENAWMRDEEHAFMRDLGSVFTGVLADGLRDIARAIPLDYFGIDCSVAPDGRLLLFEASTAMIVHMRDPVDLYPYKVQYVPRVIAALERLFNERLQRKADR